MMDSRLKFTLLVLGVGMYCCSIPGQTQELISRVSDRLDDYRMSGSIYVLHVREIPDSLTDLLLDHIETYGHVIVKFAGNPISIVRDSETLYHLLHQSVHHSKNVSIAQDLLNVAFISERTSHLLLVVDEQEAEMTVDTDMALAFLRESTIKVDVLRLPVTSGGRNRRQSVNFNHSLQSNRVNIMRLSYNASASSSFMMFVDDTMTQMIVRVQAEKAQPFVIAQMPSNMPSPVRPTTIGSASAGSVVTLLEINITQASDYGIWHIVKMDKNIWDVTIQAISPVDFTHKFVEPGLGGVGEDEIKGRPISAATYKIIVEVPEYAKVSKVLSVMLVIRENGANKGGGNLQNVGGGRGNSVFYANIAIPNEPFMVAIQGKDLSNHPFRRLDPNLITPVTLRLFIPPLTGVTLWANETLDIPFTVQNAGAVDQDIDVRIEDDQHFAFDPKIHSYNIKAGMNETGTFTIKGGPKGGVTATVTINAKPFVMGSTSLQSGQFDIRRFTVTERTTTTTQSTTTPMSTTTTHSSSSASSSVPTSSLSTLSSQSTGSTKATASGSPGASTASTAGGTLFATGTSKSSSGTQSPSGALQTGVTQTLAGTPNAGGTQSSSGASTGINALAGSVGTSGTQSASGTKSASGTQSASGPPNSGATLATSGMQLASGSPQSGATQAPPGTQLASGSPQSGATQATSGTQLASGSPQSGATQAPSGTQLASGLPQSGATQAPSGTQLASGLPQSGATQATSGTQLASGSQQSSATQALSGTQLASGLPQSGATQATSGTQLASGSQQSSATQAPSGTQLSSGSLQSGAAQAPSGTHLASGSPQSGAIQAPSETQLASGSPQSGATQPPSGTPTSGATQTAAATNNESKSSNSNNGLTAVSIGAGMGVGAVIGVTALVAMACLFKKAMSKNTKSVAPQEQGGRRDDEERRERERIQRNLAWT